MPERMSPELAHTKERLEDLKERMREDQHAQVKRRDLIPIIEAQLEIVRMITVLEDVVLGDHHEQDDHQIK